MLQQTGIVIE